MRRPTEGQAALAARQLHYHRERLRWMRGRMRDNEALLLHYLTCLEAGTAVLPGGYRIIGETSSTLDVAVEKLMPKSLYKQLGFRMGKSRIT